MLSRPGRGWLALLLLPARGARALAAREPAEEAWAQARASPALGAAVALEEDLKEDIGEDSALYASLRREPDSRELGTFTSSFQEMREREALTGQSMPPDVQLAVGVFTVASEQPYRAVVRQTWMAQRGVCLLSDGKQDGCSVYVAFVIGARGPGKRLRHYQLDHADSVTGDARKEEGMLVLDIEENMNEGKTFEYFRVVAKNYSWITHVAKCDMDTYPALHKLVYMIHKQSLCETSPYVYGGRPAMCPEEGGCEGLLRGKFTQLCPTVEGCVGQRAPWSFNFGQFYFMSMPLVREIAVKGGIWHRPPKWTHEDIIAGLAVQTFAKAQAKGNTSFCLSVWNPTAFCHRDICKYVESFNTF